MVQAGDGFFTLGCRSCAAALSLTCRELFELAGNITIVTSTGWGGLRLSICLPGYVQNMLQTLGWLFWSIFQLVLQAVYQGKVTPASPQESALLPAQLVSIPVQGLCSP